MICPLHKYTWPRGYENRKIQPLISSSHVPWWVTASTAKTGHFSLHSLTGVLWANIRSLPPSYNDSLIFIHLLSLVTSKILFSSKANSLGCHIFSWALLTPLPQGLTLLRSVLFWCWPLSWFILTPLFCFCFCGSMAYEPLLLQQWDTDLALMPGITCSKQKTAFSGQEPGPVTSNRGSCTVCTDGHLQECSTSFTGMRLLKSATPSRDFRK